mmetsp:Transcript_5592/g.15789  ORF Transcript_5592/g.15789 Transcript_5592/m.15789 type:complete len:314 (+) Transcript_5592:1101-2042(+)
MEDGQRGRVQGSCGIPLARNAHRQRGADPRVRHGHAGLCDIRIPVPRVQGITPDGRPHPLSPHVCRGWLRRRLDLGRHQPQPRRLADGVLADCVLLPRGDGDGHVPVEPDTPRHGLVRIHPAGIFLLCAVSLAHHLHPAGVRRRRPRVQTGGSTVPDEDQSDSTAHSRPPLGLPSGRPAARRGIAAFWDHFRGAVLCDDIHLAGVLLLHVRLFVPRVVPDHRHHHRGIDRLYVRPAVRRGLPVVVAIIPAWRGHIPVRLPLLARLFVQHPAPPFRGPPGHHLPRILAADGLVSEFGDGNSRIPRVVHIHRQDL